MLITLRCKGITELPQASVLKRGSVQIEAIDIKENDWLFSGKNLVLHSALFWKWELFKLARKWPKTLMKRMVR